MSTTPIGPLMQRLAALEAEVAVLRAQDSRQLDLAAMTAHRDVRLAITVNDPSADPVYPDSPANVYPIRFCDGDFPAEAGQKTITFENLSTSAEPVTHAANLTGQYLPVGTKVIATWQRGTGEDTGEWWLERIIGDAKLVHFRLTEELSCGQSAGAQIIEFNAGLGTFVDKGAITVFDDYGDRAVKAGTLVGSTARNAYASNFRGWAYKRQPDNYNDATYSIIEIDHIAKFIEGPAIELYSTGVYYISLLRWYDGQKPPVIADEATLNGKILVVDSGGADGLFFPRPPLDSEPWVKAIYNPCSGTYEVWNVQQLCPRFLVFSDEAACATETIPIFAEYYERLEFSPFDRVPLIFPPAAAQNPFGLAVEAFDWMEIQWDEFLEDWIVVQVQHHEVQVLTDIRHNNCKIQGKRKTIYASSCSSAVPQWEDVITLEEKIYVESLDWSAPSSQGGSCELKANLKALCAFPSNTDAGFQTVITVTCKTVVDDVFANGLGLYQFTTEIQQIAEASSCCTATNVEKILDFTTCDESSDGQSS